MPPQGSILRGLVFCVRLREAGPKIAGLWRLKALFDRKVSD